MKEDKLERMSFSIPEVLCRQFEQLVRESGCSNRSEFVRDMIRKQLTRKRCAADQVVCGTVSVLYDLKSTSVNSRLLETLDAAETCVLGSSRFLVSPEKALLVIACRDKGRCIRTLAENLRQLRGVIQCEFVITAFPA